MRFFNAASLLNQAVQSYPDKTFVIAGDTRLSYAQVAARAQRFATVLAQSQIKTGETIALLLPNSPDFVACYFGTLQLGITVLPLNITAPAPELAHFVADSGAALLVTTATLLPVALRALQDAPICRHVLVTGDVDTDSPPAGGQWLEPLLAAAAVTAETTLVAQDAVALLLYTSGTTGKPKAARITHGNILAFAPIFARDILELGDDAVALMAAPGSHAIGQVLLNTATYAGATLSLLPRFEPQLFVQTIQRDRVTSLIGVPTLIQILLTFPAATAEALNSLRTIMIGGAALPPDQARRFLARFNLRLKVAYAMTEAYAIAFGEITQIPENAVGRLAQGVSIRLVDDANQDVAPGAAGEILVRSPQVFAGYHNLPQQAATDWWDGWFRTGDIGYVDAEGYLFLIGRRKEIIKTSGYTVYPAEVEQVLQMHPAVAAAAVVGVPHVSVGEVVTAFVVARAGTSPAAGELMRFCKERLAGYKCPRRVEFRQALPLNSAGKILRRQLVEEGQ